MPCDHFFTSLCLSLSLPLSLSPSFVSSLSLALSLSLSLFLSLSLCYRYDVDTAQSYAGSQTVSIATPIGKIPVFQRGGYASFFSVCTLNYRLLSVYLVSFTILSLSCTATLFSLFLIFSKFVSLSLSLYLYILTLSLSVSLSHTLSLSPSLSLSLSHCSSVPSSHARSACVAARI
jgi:hypothetical protein